MTWRVTPGDSIASPAAASADGAQQVRRRRVLQQEPGRRPPPAPGTRRRRCRTWSARSPPAGAPAARMRGGRGEPVEARHPDVHQHDVGPVPAHRVDRGVAVARRHRRRSRSSAVSRIMRRPARTSASSSTSSTEITGSSSRRLRRDRATARRAQLASRRRPIGPLSQRCRRPAGPARPARPVRRPSRAGPAAAPRRRALRDRDGDARAVAAPSDTVVGAPGACLWALVRPSWTTRYTTRAVAGGSAPAPSSQLDRLAGAGRGRAPATPGPRTARPAPAVAALQHAEHATQLLQRLPGGDPDQRGALPDRLVARRRAAPARRRAAR